ncbi:hypothetical protein [Nostoc phage YongM]|nr:hypothetical protein [Nostoc phage YongM]
MKKTPKQIEIDRQRYGDRNDPKYIDLCYRTHKSSGNRCVICSKKSEEVHHGYYSGVENDTPGVNTFAVCKQCHDNVCHSSINWIPNHDNPMKSTNTKKFLVFLRQRFLFISQAFNGIKGVMSYYGKPTNKRRNSKSHRVSNKTKK